MGLFGEKEAQGQGGREKCAPLPPHRPTFASHSPPPPAPLLPRPRPTTQDKPTFEYSLKKTEFTEHNEAVARARNTRLAK